MALYCFAQRIAQDSAPLMIGRSREFADRLYGQCRLATAFAQMQANLKVVFPAGIVEWDGTRSAGSKDKSKKQVTHVGRFLIGCHRSTDHRVFLPLPNRTTKLGAPGPPACRACFSRLLMAL